MNNTKKQVSKEAPQKDTKKVLKEAPKKTTKDVVLKMDASVHYDDKIHKKVMEALSVDISGFESINVNKKNKVITVRGVVKAGELEKKLKKACHDFIKIDYFGPPREVEKPEVQNPKTTKELVLKMDATVHYDDKIHKKVMEALSVDISGFESINVNKKNKVITLRGDVKAGELEKKLKKVCHGLIKIDYIGPPREVEKSEVQNPKTTKELVLKMDASIHYDDKIHKKVMEALSVNISGFESINVNKKNKVITLRGDVEAGELEKKLKKACHGLIKIDYFGPPREVEKLEVQNPKTTKELVLKFDACVHYDDKIHKTVMEALSVDISGFESININKKNKVITVKGDVKAGELEKKLKKACHGHIEIDYVGSPREVKKSEVKKPEVQNPGVVGVVMKVFTTMFSKQVIGVERK